MKYVPVVNGNVSIEWMVDGKNREFVLKTKDEVKVPESFSMKTTTSTDPPGVFYDAYVSKPREQALYSSNVMYRSNDVQNDQAKCHAPLMFPYHSYVVNERVVNGGVLEFEFKY